MVHVLTVRDGRYLTIGEVASQRREPVVGVDRRNIVRITEV